jgi:hypothetical protein
VPWRLKSSSAEPRAPTSAEGTGGARAPLALTPTTRIDRPRLPSPMLQCIFQVFQSFQMYVAVVSYGCCKNRLGMLHMLQVFQKHVVSICSKCSISRCRLQSFFIRLLHMFSHICCNSMFQIFQLFQSYVASVLSRYCICFTHLLQAYVPNVLFVSNVCCIRVFHVTSANHRRWCP